MQRSILAVFALTAVLACTAGAYGDVIASSSFNAGVEGWQATLDTHGVGTLDTAHTVAAVWETTGGNPGGCVSNVDPGVGGTWYWTAPSAFLGDIHQAVGGTLTYDMWATNHGNWTRTDIVLKSTDGTVLTTSMGGDPGNTWTSFTIPMTAGNWNNQTAGHAATAGEFLQVLSSVDQLWIRGEFYNGPDQGFLDNVVLTAGPTPEPATLALLALGGIGLLRRKSR